MSDYLLSFNDEDCLFPFNGVKPKSFGKINFSPKEQLDILSILDEDSLDFDEAINVFYNIPKEVVSVLKRTSHTEEPIVKKWFDFFNLVRSKLNENECCQFYIYRDEIVFINSISKTADVDLLCITHEEIKLYQMEYTPTTAY